MKYSDVITFWFDEISPEQWWVKDKKFDDEIARRFKRYHDAANAGELFHWREHTQGRLAEIVVLDQFSRNIYRDTPKAFASDGLALVLAQEIVALELDKTLPDHMQSFIYLPYMHSESLLIHDEAVKLYTALGDESNLGFEQKHRDIIKEFGRYPHRNMILGRESTSKEDYFLEQPNSSF